MPQEPGYTPGRSGEECLLHRLAENGDVVAYTAVEYGVRKDDGGGLVKPVNSSGGLLFLAILLTVTMGGLVYFVVQVIIQDAWDIAGEVWWVFPAWISPLSRLGPATSPSARPRNCARPATSPGRLSSVHAVEESRGEA